MSDGVLLIVNLMDPSVQKLQDWWCFGWGGGNKIWN